MSSIYSSSNTWLIDSGTTNHMTSNSSLLDFLTLSCVKSVQVANGAPMSILEAGNVSLSPTFFMSSVLFA
ncbi:MAG: hypothetical protein K6253_01790, partial [Candidatus Liberibacter asiaticus]|nr:hypothetical protein [Candidatus Liberibacter asiaticus]